MKSMLITAIALISFNSFASGFECLSTSTGLRYVVDQKSKTVSVYDKKLISVEKFTSVTFESFESYPSLDVYSFRNQNGVFMEISEKAGKITGSFDDDEDLVCVSRR